MKKILAYSIIAFWVVMAALFARREIIPDLYARPMQGYAGVRAYAQSHAGYRMGIQAPNGTRMGSTETTYQIKENGDCIISASAEIQFERHSLVALSMATGADAEGMSLKLWSDVIVGSDDALRSFRVECNAGPLRAVANGFVLGDLLRITVSAAGSVTEKTIPISREDAVSIGLMAVGELPDLKEGQTWQTKMLDPLTLALGTVQLTTGSARVVRKTRIELRGHWYPVFEVELVHGPAITQAWVTENGDVLREKAFGFVMTREPLPHEMTGKPGETLETEPALTPRPAPDSRSVPRAPNAQHKPERGG